MLEKDLVGASFLVPTETVEVSHGYCYRDLYCNALKRGAQIGHYNADGQFVPDLALTFLYQGSFAKIADALLQDTRSPLYRRYKLAALEKSLLGLHLEWPAAEVFESQHMSLPFGRLLRDHIGLPTVLVDLQGPAYEVVVPDTVDAFLAGVEHVHMVAA